MTKTPEELRNFLTKTFGDFKDFKEEFFRIQFGALPPIAHPHPRTIVKIKKMKEWPYSFRELDNLYAVCYICKERGLFSGCKLCAKVVTTGCRGLKQEAHEEEYREMVKERQKKGRKSK